MRFDLIGLSKWLMNWKKQYWTTFVAAKMKKKKFRLYVFFIFFVAMLMIINTGLWTRFIICYYFTSFQTQQYANM